MTTIDLRAELVQEIQNIPDSEQLLLRVMNYVRNLMRKEDVELAFTGDALRLWDRTVELSSLKPGWDGADAMPMQKRTVQNVQRLIKAGVSSDFKEWVLFPDDNGTMLLQSKDGTASISIGNSSYSFVSTKGGQIKAEERVRFSPMAVLNTMRTISKA